MIGSPPAVQPDGVAIALDPENEMLTDPAVILPVITFGTIADAEPAQRKSRIATVTRYFTFPLFHVDVLFAAVHLHAT